ncbi:MAG: hypothetical protein AB2L24_23625 [Mangrovibacterium sp.]
MTNKETVERNIGLTFDFVDHLIDNPDHAENLPDNFTLEFIEKDFPKVEKKQPEKETKTKRKYVRVRNSFEFSK